MNIRPTGSSSATVSTGSVRRSTVGVFTIPLESRPAETAAAIGCASLDGLLSLQEIDSATERDRRARRHGATLLDALAAIQRGCLAELLGSSPDLAPAERLAELSRQIPLAADPRLRVLIAAIALRAHVELARQEMMAVHSDACMKPNSDVPLAGRQCVAISPP